MKKDLHVKYGVLCGPRKKELAGNVSRCVLSAKVVCSVRYSFNHLANNESLDYLGNTNS